MVTLLELRQNLLTSINFVNFQYIYFTFYNFLCIAHRLFSLLLEMQSYLLITRDTSPISWYNVYVHGFYGNFSEFALFR